MPALRRTAMIVCAAWEHKHGHAWGRSVCGACGGGGAGDADECVFGGRGWGGAIRIKGAQSRIVVAQERSPAKVGGRYISQKQNQERRPKGTALH